MSEKPLKLLRRETCPVCGYRDPRVIYEKMFTEHPIGEYLRTWYRGRVPLSRLEANKYAVMDCPDCGLLYQRDVLDDEGLALLYGFWINPEASARRSPLRARQEGLAAARQIHALESLPSGPAGMDDIVELGCSWGNWLLMARAFGYRVTGVEIDRRRRAALIAQGIPCYESCDELPEESVDFVYAQQVFEHLRQPLEVLKSLARALRPGGYVQIAVPNARWIRRNLKQAHLVRPTGSTRRIRRSLSAIAPLEHINAFARKSLLRLSAEAGLSPHATRSVSFPARTTYDYAQKLPRLIYGVIRGHAAVSVISQKK